MEGRREEDRKQFVKKCLKEYYEKDTKILIDSSICRVFCTKYVLGDLVYFGNKLIISEEELEEIKKFAADDAGYSNWKQIRKKNAQLILFRMKKDVHDNIEVVTMPEEVRKVERLEKYLKENPAVILYVQNNEIYNELKERGLRHQLYLMYDGMRDIGIFHNKFKFETIGAIQFENDKMRIYKPLKQTTEIKVFDSKGERKEEDRAVEVEPRDFIVIKSLCYKKEDMAKSIKLYEVISRHSRNHASLVLWTTLKAHETTNRYIENLPYLLQSIIAK